MLSINRYYKVKFNGQVDYALASAQLQMPSQLENQSSPEDVDVDEIVDDAKNNVITARYVGESSSEETSVYEVTCVGGSKFLTDSDGRSDLFPGSITEYVRTTLSNGNRKFVNSDYSFRVNPLHVVSIVPTADGYDNIEDAENDDNSVSCYKVTLTNGESFITNSGGRTPLDTNGSWC